MTAAAVRTASVTVLVGVAVLVVWTFSPPLREALIAIEPALATVLFLVAAAGAVARWRTRASPSARRRLRRLEARAGCLAARWGWAGAILLMLAPLWAHWAFRPPGGTTALAALLGHLPWSDAIGHFEGGVRLLTDGVFGAYSERRPLNAAWLAVRLAASGGSLPFALVSQAVIAGLAAFLLARVVGLRFGLWPALATFGLVQGLTRDGIPTAATEPLGITLGCVALTLLLARETRTRLAAAAVALFALDVALNARPGPQFLAPAIALWGIVTLRVRWWRAAAVLLLAVLVSAANTRALNALYGAGEGSFTTYPAYTLYGLTRDSNYKQAQHDYGDEIALLGSERDVARFLYARSFEAMTREPGLFARALVRNELKFFDKLAANLARIVTLRAFFSPAEERARPSIGERAWNLVFGLPILLAAVAAALVGIARSRDRVYRLFWLAAALGILGSVPFVYGDAGFRGLAASYPFFALFLGLGLGARRRPLLGPRSADAERRLARAALAVSVGIVVLSLTVPALAHRLWPRPDASQLAGAKPGETMVVRLEDAPAVLVLRVRRAGLSEVPWMEKGTMTALLDLADLKDDSVFAAQRSPFALASVFDCVTHRQVLMIGPVDLLRQKGYVSVDIEPLDADGRIVRATSP